MVEPIVFVSHFRLKEGRFDALREFYQEASKLLQSDKPRTLVYLGFVDDQRARVTFVHLFANRESMDLHWSGADQRSTAAYELLEPDGFEIYGTPSDSVLEGMRLEAAAAAVPFTFQPEGLGGFLRLEPA